MDTRLPRAEQLMPFLDSVPPDKRDLCWLPTKHVTLTLPDREGCYTAFTQKWCPQERLTAYNIALYGVSPCPAPPLP